MQLPRLSFALVLLSACALGPYPPSSPYYKIPAGTRLHLQQALTIPPNTARVYIQYGKVVTHREMNQYYAHCWFLSNNVLDTEQVIEPDSFTVVKSQKYEDVIQTQPESRYLLASRVTGRGVFSSGGITAIEYSTRLYIHSSKQPHIIQFICSAWEDPIDAKHLSVPDMRKVVGEIVDIELIETKVDQKI